MAKTVKVAYDFSLEAKYNLTRLKMELRYQGVRATETGILEVLVNGAEVDDLAAAYKKHLRSLGNKVS